MKKSIIKIAVAALILSNAIRVHAADVTFEIQDIRSSDGKLYIQMFKGADDYAKGKASFMQIAKAKKGTATISFPDVEDGEYAIRFFHDENDNGKMETNMLGMPTEGYGFSNNAQPNFGPAKYKDMKFGVGSKAVKNAAKVIY
jgi:uncharacterized protein (DUF2141 family)